MLTHSSENLMARLQSYPAFVTTNNAYNDFNIRVPDGSVVHWAAHIGPLLRKSLAVFERDSTLKSLTFAELKEKAPVVYNDAIEALNFIVRFGGRV